MRASIVLPPQEPTYTRLRPERWTRPGILPAPPPVVVRDPVGELVVGMMTLHRKPPR